MNSFSMELWKYFPLQQQLILISMIFRKQMILLHKNPEVYCLNDHQKTIP
jgi:hypothetical protein